MVHSLIHRINSRGGKCLRKYILLSKPFPATRNNKNTPSVQFCTKGFYLLNLIYFYILEAIAAVNLAVILV